MADKQDLFYVCPVTKRSLVQSSLEEAESRLAGGNTLLARSDGPVEPVGATETVLARSDGECAYPVVGGIPVLLYPERLVPPERGIPQVDFSDPRYAEAYSEMNHYNATAPHDDVPLDLLQQAYASPDDTIVFPRPPEVWLDSTFEPAAQWDAYNHLAPIQGSRILQVGGKGSDAIKFLLAGAKEAHLLTPMIGEIEYTAKLATHLGLQDRFRGVLAVAEEMPFPDASFDAAYSDGSLHHTVTHLVAHELRRVLRPGGRFAAIEPWRAPLYKLGTKVFGRREEGVGCVILSMPRAQPFLDAFDDAKLIHHGALTRYPLLALNKLGYEFRLPTVWLLSRLDDALCSLVPALRRSGSIVALLGVRPED